MIQEADLIVQARLAGRRQGRVVGSGSGAPPVVFELNDFDVDEILKASPTAQEAIGSGRIVVERAAWIAGDRPILASHDGGPFANGTHVLFLRRQRSAPFAFILLNDQGRAYVAGGRLYPVSRGAVAAEMLGRDLSDIRTEVAQAP
jgi:hypothetical protein